MTVSSRTKLFVGTSGWSYPDWKGDFYPPRLARNRFLEYYATRFPATELNASFYRLPSEKMIAGWLERTPEDFRFCVKLSRLITHQKRLADCDRALDVFLARLAPLQPRMGPVLAQLPPSLVFDPDRVADFLRAWRRRSRIPLAIEARHRSWRAPAASQLLTRHGVIVVRADSGGYWPRLESNLDNETYLRYHGPGELYASSYTPQKLGRDASRIAGRLNSGGRVWAFFNNTDAGDAWRDAEKLIERVRARLA